MNKLDGLVEAYLNDVDSQLADITKSQRQELRLDLQTHIDLLRSDEHAESEADIRNILDRLGSPETVAAAARAESGAPAETVGSRSRRLKRVLIWSLVAAAVLLIVVYFMFFSFYSEDSQTAGAAFATEVARMSDHHG